MLKRIRQKALALTMRLFPLSVAQQMALGLSFAQGRTASIRSTGLNSNSTYCVRFRERLVLLCTIRFSRLMQVELKAIWFLLKRTTGSNAWENISALTT